jgi:hypothetical protein
MIYFILILCIAMQSGCDELRGCAIRTERHMMIKWRRHRTAW